MSKLGEKIGNWETNKILGKNQNLIKLKIRKILKFGEKNWKFGKCF